nr:MAG TPA: hypothetical protein [Caudoviricetes sp.]
MSGNTRPSIRDESHAPGRVTEVPDRASSRFQSIGFRK